MEIKKRETNTVSLTFDYVVKFAEQLNTITTHRGRRRGGSQQCEQLTVV